MQAVSMWLCSLVILRLQAAIHELLFSLGHQAIAPAANADVDDKLNLLLEGLRSLKMKQVGCVCFSVFVVP